MQPPLLLSDSHYHVNKTHIKVELGSVKLARMRTLAGPVSIHICFCHLLSATGAIVNVYNIILKYYVNVKIEKNFWKD